MKLENLVCSIEDTLFYKTQGLIYPSYFKRWKGNILELIDIVDEIDFDRDEHFWENIGPAYNADELSILLPGRVYYEENDFFLKSFKGNNGWIVSYETNSLGTIITEEDIIKKKKALFSTYKQNYNLAKVFSSWLRVLIESKLISIGELNVK
jgi:hypothetical protein